MEHDIDLIDMVKAAVAIKKILDRGPGHQYVNRDQLEALRLLLKWLKEMIEQKRGGEPR